MKKTPPIVLDLKHLPTDVILLQSIIVSLASSNERLLHQLREATRRHFGRKSEAVSQEQMALFGKLIEERLAGVPAMATTPAQPEARLKGHGRGTPSAALPRRHEHYPLSDSSKSCRDCHQPLKKIGTESRQVVEYVPASLLVKVQTCEKWACPACQGAVVTSEAPELPLAKGLAGEGLLAHVVTGKYADHLPLYRQARILRRQGLDVSRSTLAGWVAQVADLVQPLYLALKADVLGSKVIHGDDTTVPVLEGKQRRSPRLGRKARLGRLWAWVGDKDHPHTVYSFSPNRKQAWPLDFVAGWKGYLQADAYSGYHPLYLRGIQEVACWAHARRKYVEAMETDPETGQAAVAFIHRLYEVERQAKGLGAAERKRLRQLHSRPTLDAFKAWLDAQALKALPKSAMGQAVGYSLRQWAALERYLDDGDLAIDNNPAENALRAVALGRKNWLFAGSDKGGERAAILYSVIESCRRHDLDPFEYLRNVVGTISGTPRQRVSDLLPANWKAARAQRLAA